MLRRFAIAWMRVVGLLLLPAACGCDLFFEPPPEPRPAEFGPIARHRDDAPIEPDATRPRAQNDAGDRELAGEVDRVADGDTITVRDPSGRFSSKIRLVGIDAPELDQPFGRESRRALDALTRGKQVRVLWRERDQFDRILGDVYLGDEHVNLALVRAGWAWQYQHARDAKLAAAEQTARSERRGLWADDDPEPPWDFRRDQQRRRGNDSQKRPAR